MLGAVLYTDGGSIGTPGAGGSGVHGYIYQFKHPKKGTGNADVVMTQKGYYDLETLKCILKQSNAKKKQLQEAMPQYGEYETYNDCKETFFSDVLHEVEPIKYIDGFQSYGTLKTNNQTELGAIILSLKTIIENKIRFALLLSDSEYVVKGINEYLPKWRDNNFKRADGTEIKNLDLWMEVSALLGKVYSEGIEIAIKWIKGHADHLGNEKADKLATIGVNYSQAVSIIKGTDSFKVCIVEADGYWKNSFEKPDLFFNRYVIYNAANADTGNTYFTCNTSQPLRFLGSHQSDASFSYVTYKDDYHASTLSVLKEVAVKQANLIGNLSIMVAVNTDSLFNDNVLGDIGLGGVDVLSVGKDYKHELYTADRASARKAITEVINPPYISFRIEEIMARLSSYYQAMYEKDNRLVLTDLTDVFYQSVEKKKKKEIILENQLKDKFAVGHAKETVKAQYFDTVENKLKETNVILVLGQDLPDRNTLKRLEDKSPKVTLLTMAETASVFTYAVLVETTEGEIMTCSYFSNLRVLSREELST